MHVERSLSRMIQDADSSMDHLQEKSKRELTGKKIAPNMVGAVRVGGPYMVNAKRFSHR